MVIPVTKKPEDSGLQVGEPNSSVPQSPPAHKDTGVPNGLFVTELNKFLYKAQMTQKAMTVLGTD